MPDLWNASSTFRRLAIFLILVSESVAVEFLAQLVDLAIEIDLAQQLADAFRAHHRGEVVAELFDLGQIIVLGQQLPAMQRRQARHSTTT